MENETSHLSAVYEKALTQLLAFEKSCKKRYQKLAKACLTPELAKALHPDQTNIDNHIKRLKLIYNNPASSISPFVISGNDSNWSRKKTNLQDLEIINETLYILGFKIAQYEFLDILAKAMDQAHSPQLFTQSISENNDTGTWLKQIARNVILRKI